MGVFLTHRARPRPYRRIFSGDASNSETSSSRSLSFSNSVTRMAIVGELAERWAWQENYRKLVFFLRRDVRWHDGKPFSSKDVKYTFDLLRETPDAPAKLRLNARREWYANVEAVDAVDPQT